MKLWIQWEYGPDEAERAHYTEIFERTAEAALQEEGVEAAYGSGTECGGR